MNENIKKFLVKVAQDPELSAKMSQIRDPEEAFKLAASVQDGFTKEEFETAMASVKEFAEKSGDLSEEDLSKMAGGFDVIEDINWTDVGIGAGAGAGGAVVSVAAAWAAI